MTRAKEKRTIRAWLRAIADCGTLRVAFDCPALIEAWEIGLVDCSPVDRREDALDFRLTADGRRSLELWSATA
jgi:hypothetical protein